MADTFRKLVTESPVGSKGRTTHADADEYIDNNPQIVEEFRKIVNGMGGKSVARRVLDRMGAKKEQDITESKINDVEKYLRGAGFKIKTVHPNQDGSKEIEFYNVKDRDVALEDLKDANALHELDIVTIGVKSLLVKDV